MEVGYLMVSPTDGGGIPPEWLLAGSVRPIHACSWVGGSGLHRLVAMATDTWLFLLFCI